MLTIAPSTIPGYKAFSKLDIANVNKHGAKFTFLNTVYLGRIG
eukprot:COSAG02_NODE_1418_length_12720_cov_20.079629_9_plen_43_part_00